MMMRANLSSPDNLKWFYSGQVNHSRADNENRDMHHHRVFFWQNVLGNLFSIHDSQADQYYQKNHFYLDPVGFREHPCIHCQKNSGDKGHSQYGVVDKFVDASLGFFQPQDFGVIF